MTGSQFKEQRSEQRIGFDSTAIISSGQHSIAASTKDLSERGMFLFTDAHFELGSEIDMVVMLPEILGLPVNGMVCCHGRIVRSDSSGRQYGIAVEIDRMVPMPQVG